MFNYSNYTPGYGFSLQHFCVGSQPKSNGTMSDETKRLQTFKLFLTPLKNDELTLK